MPKDLVRGREFYLEHLVDISRFPREYCVQQNKRLIFFMTANFIDSVVKIKEIVE